METDEQQPSDNCDETQYVTHPPRNGARAPGTPHRETRDGNTHQCGQPVKGTCPECGGNLAAAEDHKFLITVNFQPVRKVTPSGTWGNQMVCQDCGLITEPPLAQRTPRGNVTELGDGRGINHDEITRRGIVRILQDMHISQAQLAASTILQRTFRNTWERVMGTALTKQQLTHYMKRDLRRKPGA